MALWRSAPPQRTTSLWPARSSFTERSRAAMDEAQAASTV